MEERVREYGFFGCIMEKPCGRGHNGAGDDVEGGPLLKGFGSNAGSIVSICLAHLCNDWYMNYLQSLLPFLVAAGLGVSKGAFLISAFTVTSSLLQPISGYLVDQRNQRCHVGIRHRDWRPGSRPDRIAC
jgi:hypothetical protein